MPDFTHYQDCQQLLCQHSCTLEMFEDYHFQAGQTYQIEVMANNQIIVFPELAGCYFHCEDQHDYALLTTNFTR